MQIYLQNIHFFRQVYFMYLTFFKFRLHYIDLLGISYGNFAMFVRKFDTNAFRSNI